MDYTKPALLTLGFFIGLAAGLLTNHSLLSSEKIIENVSEACSIEELTRTEETGTR